MASHQDEDSDNSESQDTESEVMLDIDPLLFSEIFVYAITVALCAIILSQLTLNNNNNKVQNNGKYVYSTD